jgi:Bacterial dipeptidyl-peptidase Sh3 domain
LSAAVEDRIASYTMTGPSRIADASRTPIRGDLAHIGLAGRYFVPHYAVPQARRIAASGAALLKAGRADADVIAELAAGAPFDVLDIAGLWAWGQQGTDGLVGYVALDQLDAAEA